jgi:hypothetical protein
MALLDALSSGLGYLGDVEEKFGGRALRGALAGKPRELLSPIPFSDTLGITDPTQRTSGAELAGRFGIGSPGGWGRAGAGLGIDIATDPLSYIGGLGAGAKAARAAPEAAQAASRFGALKALREPATLVKNLGSFGGERIVGNRLARAAAGIDPMLSDLAIEMHNAAPAMGRMVSPYAEGSLENLRNFGFSRGGVPTERQELHHALLKNAAMSGQYGGLNLPSQAVSRLLGAGLRRESPLLMGLGEAGLETLGHGAEVRGAIPQLGEMAKFTYSPAAHAGYHPQIAGQSPLAAALWHAAPGAVPGAIAGGVGGGVGGYEQGGVGGALGGGLAGVLGGATLGGGISHLALAPRGAGLVQALQRGGLAGESAARPLTYYDQAARAMAERGTPLNRFQRLAEAAKVGFSLPRTKEELIAALGPSNQDRIMAAYNPLSRTVSPNIQHFPAAWMNTEYMKELLDPGRMGANYFSTPLADQLALHEITHGLHHAQNTPAEVLKNPWFFSNLDLAAARPNVATGAPSLWERYKGVVPSRVSHYGATSPTEFVAERNPQRIMAHLADMTSPVATPGLGPRAEMSKLYAALRGPGNPTSLLDEFDRLYGGDINRAIRGESAAQLLGRPVPNPADLAARRALEGKNWEMASGKPARFSTDQARRDYMAKYRQMRYAKRMGAPAQLVDRLRQQLTSRRAIPAALGPLLGAMSNLGDAGNGELPALQPAAAGV